MRHKLPYAPDTTEKGSSLTEGVTAHQTMDCCDDDHWRSKERLERSVSKSGQADHDAVVQTSWAEPSYY